MNSLFGKPTNWEPLSPKENRNINAHYNKPIEKIKELERQLRLEQKREEEKLKVYNKFLPYIKLSLLGVILGLLLGIFIASAFLLIEFISFIAMFSMIFYKKIQIKRINKEYAKRSNN